MADGAIFEPQTAKLVLEVVRYMQSAGFVLKAGQGSAPSGLYASPPIFVRNESSETIPPFACLQSTNTVDYGETNYVLVDQPVDTGANAGGYLFNGPTPIEKRDHGLAFDGPFLRALVEDESTPESGMRYRPTVGEWYLTEDETGAMVAAGPDEIGEHVARIWTSGRSTTGESLFIFRMHTAFISNAAASDIYTIDGASFTDTGIDDTVYDPLGVFAVLPSLSYGLCIKQAGKYYAIQAGCPD